MTLAVGQFVMANAGITPTPDSQATREQPIRGSRSRDDFRRDRKGEERQRASRISRRSAPGDGANRGVAASVLVGGVAYRLFLWLLPFGLIVGGVLGLGDASGVEDAVASGGLPAAVVAGRLRPASARLCRMGCTFLPGAILSQSASGHPWPAGVPPAEARDVGVALRLARRDRDGPLLHVGRSSHRRDGSHPRRVAPPRDGQTTSRTNDLSPPRRTDALGITRSDQGERREELLAAALTPRRHAFGAGSNDDRLLGEHVRPPAGEDDRDRRVVVDACATHRQPAAPGNHASREHLRRSHPGAHGRSRSRGNTDPGRDRGCAKWLVGRHPWAPSSRWFPQRTCAGSLGSEPPVDSRYSL